MRRAGFKREKNWGFIAEGDALLVYYSLLPCTVVLQFDPAAEGGLVMRSRACYERQAAGVARATGPLWHSRACGLQVLSIAGLAGCSAQPASGRALHAGLQQ